MLMIICGMAAYAASEVFRAPIPPSQVISEKFNLCIHFEGNPGSGEERLMYTHRCNIALTKNQFGQYDEHDYLDFLSTMECPKIEVADRDNDGIKEIYAVQEWLCKQFAHPWEKDPAEMTYKIDQNGKISEVNGR